MIPISSIYFRLDGTKRTPETMDIVQFLFAVVNLLLALVVLFGGRLVFDRLTRLREDVEALKQQLPHREGSDDSMDPSHGWKE